MKEINLILNVEDANLILQSLGNLPYVQVHELIGKIQRQASVQVAENQQPEPERVPVKEA